MKLLSKFSYPAMSLILFFLVSQILIALPVPAFSENKMDYEVVVVGGEPEGVAAAVSAARNGAHTLLIAEDNILGGTMTVANLTNIDMNYGPSRQLLTKGIFSEFLHWVRGDSFDVERARETFHVLTAQERNLTTLLETKVEKPIFASDGKTLIGLHLLRNGRVFTICGKRFIDATADADLAVQSGVPYTIGKEDMGLGKRVMAPTLVFQVGGVNWNRVVSYLREDKTHLSGANSFSAWGYNKIMKGYKPLDPEVKVRALNIGRQNNGSVMINALLIFDVNPLNHISLKNAMAKGKREVERIVPYLKEHAPGFEEAYLIGTAGKLYVRESRHIKGVHQLTIDDVLNNTNFPDKIALGSYPVDVQASTKEENGFVIGVPKMYSIPFRSLVPLKVENLLVVGRSAAYTSLAAGSARVIPVGMVEGQSAGFAALYSLHRNMTFRQLSKNSTEIKKMQKSLRNQGVYLPEFSVAPPKESKEWTYPYMEILRRKGLAVSDYKNNYGLNNPIKPLSFVTLVRRTIETFPRKIRMSIIEKQIVMETNEPINYTNAVKILDTARKNYLATIGIKQQGVLHIPKDIEIKIIKRVKKTQHPIITKGEAFALAYQFDEQIKKDLAHSRK